MLKSALTALFLATVALPAVTPAFADIAVRTATGDVTLPGVPERPVVYDLAALDTLLALGVTPAGVPTIPAGAIFDPARNAPAAGTLFEPDLEALAGLNPDLIVIGGRSAPKAAEVAPIGTTIDMTIGTDVVATARERIGTWGTVFGKEAEAAALAETFDARLAELRSLATDKGKALVVMTNGPKMSAYGIGSRMGWLHELTALPEAKPGLSTERHGNSISHEFIAETDPDWIFVIDRSAAVGQAEGGAQETFSNPLIAGTKAAKAGHIVYLSPWAIYLSAGGYSSTMQVMDELITALKG